LGKPVEKTQQKTAPDSIQFEFVMAIIKDFFMIKAYKDRQVINLHIFDIINY